jgi:LmbE family N-acetylglucosaminyl deacetylase
VFGAHPDDCELGAGGLAALYVSLGHQVKFGLLTRKRSPPGKERSPKAGVVRLSRVKQSGELSAAQPTFLPNNLQKNSNKTISKF